MLRKTPKSLGVKLIVSSPASPVYILCHPTYEGHPDRAISVIFEIVSGEGNILRIFDTEIVSMDVRNDQLFAVDNKQKVYEYQNGSWIDFDNPPLVPYRINGIKVVKDEVFGIGDDGLVYLWENDAWRALTKEIEDLYLFDLTNWPNNGPVVCGDEGFLAIMSDGAMAPIEVATNVALTSVCLLSDNSLLVTGRRATAFRLVAGEVVEIDSGERTLSFLNSVVWNERVLIAANSEIVEVVKNEIVEFSEKRTGRLHVHNSILWCQSEGAPFYTKNGTDWNEVQLSVEV